MRKKKAENENKEGRLTDLSKVELTEFEGAYFSKLAAVPTSPLLHASKNPLKAGLCLLAPPFFFAKKEKRIRTHVVAFGQFFSGGEEVRERGDAQQLWP